MGSHVLFVASCLLLVSHFIAPCSLPKFPSRRVFFFLSGVVHLQTTSSFNYEFTLKWPGAQDTDSVETIVLCWIMIKWPGEQRSKSSEYSCVMLNYGPESLSKRDNCITNWITPNNDWSWMAWRASSLESREDNCMTLTDNWIGGKACNPRAVDHCVILHYDYMARRASYIGCRVDSCILLMQIKPWKQWKQLGYAYIARETN